MPKPDTDSYSCRLPNGNTSADRKPHSFDLGWNSDSYRYLHSNGDSYLHSNGDRYGYCNCDCNSNSNTSRNTDANPCAEWMCPFSRVVDEPPRGLVRGNNSNRVPDIFAISGGCNHAALYER